MCGKTVQDVKQQIRIWIAEEEIALAEMTDPEAHFNFMLTLQDGRTLHIVQPLRKKDSITVVTRALLTDQQKKHFQQKTRLERKEVLSDLRFTLAGVDVQFNLEFESEGVLNAIRIEHPIYYDALTKDRLMHSTFTVLKAFILVEWKIGERI